MPAVYLAVYLVAEIATFVAVAHLAGVVAAILLLIACSAAGVLLVAGQGRKVLDGFRRVGRGELTPGTAVADGALVATGALLVLVPGLLTSILGLLMLLPPTRALLRPVLTAFAARRAARVLDTVQANRVVIDADGTVVDGAVVHTVWDPAPGDSGGRSLTKG
ncbi:FxsA family protein [Nocardia sp. NPDC057353]|uniref:FxsA family protein n=1 Tax=Nocardia sp. NPDC057353 TaxID=3346104 RepID=UPI0036405721